MDSAQKLQRDFRSSEMLYSWLAITGMTVIEVLNQRPRRPNHANDLYAVLIPDVGYDEWTDSGIHKLRSYLRDYLT